MDYHVHRHGQDLGILSLAELERRRMAGELAGDELVWREGMDNWTTLDALLAAQPSGARPPPVPAVSRQRKKNVLLICGIVGGVLLAAASVTFTTLMFVKFARRVRTVVQTQTAPRADRGDAMELASRPIPANPKTLSAKDVSQRGRAFRVRQYVDAYRAHGSHSAPWDHEAAQLMESWVAASYGGPTNLPSPEKLGDKLAATPGCDDPLVLTAAASQCFELNEKTRRLERAVAAYEGSRYQAYPRFYATVSLAAELGRRSPRLPALDQNALRLFTQALTDGSFQPEDEPEIAEILVHGWATAFFQRHAGAVCRAAKQAGEYPWLAGVLEGEHEIELAWQARGSGWSDSVTAQGWQQFAAHLEQARTALTEAWKLHPERPLAADRMITVALGQESVTEMRTWFDRAVEAQIDYPQAWSDFRWGLRPRWYGSQEAMLALGVQAVKTKRFDTDVPRKLFDSIKDVESEMTLEPGEHIYGRPNVWPYLKEMYEGYLAAPEQEQWRAQWHAAYAAVAYLASQYGTAREQLEAVDWKPIHENLTGWGTDLSLMPLKVAALTGSSADQVRRAEDAYSREDLAAAAEIYTALTSAPDNDERTREFGRARLAAIRQEELLAKGEWINLLPADDKDPNWEFAGDKLRWVGKAAVEVDSGPRGHAFYCRTRVGPEFEVTGEFEVVRSSTQDFQAGLMMGLPDNLQSLWYGFRMKRNAKEGDVASFSRGWTRDQVARKITLQPDTNSFQFRVQRGTADAWVNGVEVLHRAAPAKLYLSTESLLGLGAFNDMNETVIRYSHVKARRLVPGQ